MARRTRSRRSAKRHEAPEKAVQRKIRSAAEQLGFQVDDMSQPRRSMMPRGLPDLRIRHKAKRFRAWVECKSEAGRVSPEQMGWHAMEEACGGIVIVADSVESFLSGLKAAGFPIDGAGL